jgi:hypothetical protein
MLSPISTSKIEFTVSSSFAENLASATSEPRSSQGLTSLSARRTETAARDGRT